MDKSKILIDILNKIEGFPQKDKKNVDDLIEHNEWGVALEIICSVILQEKIMVSKRVYDEIINVGNEMKMEPCLWKGISNLLK